MSRFFKVLIYFSFLLVTCIPQEIDYNELNRLIENEQYDQAIAKIIVYKETTSNHLEIQKLNQLYISADKSLLFNHLQTRLDIKDTSNIINELDIVFSKIQLKDSLFQRWYYFTYYLRLGQYYSIANDSAKHVKNLLKAVEFPDKDIQKKINVFLDLAFHYAELKQFDKAREWLDKALRSFNKNEHKGQLLDAYMAYMNGNYLKADSILAFVPRENKNLNWQRVESFFNLYINSLSLKDRFRLW